jgi:hypothetical protein
MTHGQLVDGGMLVNPLCRRTCHGADGAPNEIVGRKDPRPLYAPPLLPL